MIFQLFKGTNDKPETTLSQDEEVLKEYLHEKLYIFPINRIRIRKEYSQQPNEISLEVELDDSIGSEVIYNRIVSNFFNHLNIELVTLENKGDHSNFGYFFFGEAEFLGYQCILFVDVPKENYIPSNELSL